MKIGTPVSDVVETVRRGLWRFLPLLICAALWGVSTSPSPAGAQETATTTVDATATTEEESPTPTDTPEPMPTPLATDTPARTDTPDDTEIPQGTETSSPSPTTSPTPSVTRTPNPTLLACVGNCNGDSTVTVDELIKAVNISLDVAPITDCFAADSDKDFFVRIDELIRAVSNALNGCGIRPPTEIPTRTVTTTPSPSPSSTGTLSNTPTVLLTATSTPTVSSTATRTATPTSTPIGTPSICGGFVSIFPQLCNVQVEPPVVRLFGSFTVRYCLADLDGNVNELCIGIQTSPQAPPLQCTSTLPPLQTVNDCFVTRPIASTNPAGSYVLHMYAQDRAGNRTTVQMAPFQIR